MKVICYSIRRLKPTERTRFQRDMYGFKDISNRGRYEYLRQGLMNSIPHEKVYYTGLLVEDIHAKKILKVLRKHKIVVHVVDASH